MSWVLNPRITATEVAIDGEERRNARHYQKPQRRSLPETGAKRRKNAVQEDSCIVADITVVTEKEYVLYNRVPRGVHKN